jgi:hypothetical protein
MYHNLYLVAFNMDGWAQLTEKADGIKYAHDEITCKKPVLFVVLPALFVCCSESSSRTGLNILHHEVIRFFKASAISSLEMHSRSISSD